MTGEAKLRIGLLVDSPLVSKYVLDLVDWSNAQPDLAITHLLLHLSPPGSGRRPLGVAAPARAGRLYAALSRTLFRVLTVIETILLRRHRVHRDHLATFNMEQRVPASMTLSAQVSPSGLSYRFDGPEAAKVRALDLDVLVLCGGSILRGEILSASRFGVLSVHHGDNRINRGTPAGFWEVYLRRDTTGFTLQRLTEELAGGEVLMRGHFPTRHYYLLNEAELFTKSNQFLKLALARLAKSRRLPDVLPATPYSHALLRAPRAEQSIRHLARLGASILQKKVRRVLGRGEHWHVSFIRSNWRNAVLRRGVKIPNPPGHYLADPFAFSRDGKDYCFVEDYDCAAERGSIAVYQLDNQRATRLGTALTEAFHLSFPYVFQHDGELFMCPESSANKDIRVYRCVEFPLRWQLAQILMSDISSVDSMLFEQRGTWWMLTNPDLTGTGDHSSQMSIFSAASPLATSWNPHPQNPVVNDAAYARNAGLLRDGSQLFRVSQRQGFDRYGKGAQINEILELTSDVYREDCICRIDPAFESGLIGIHHFHGTDDITVFDWLRMVRTKAGSPRR